MQHIVISNYGDESIALLQWILANKVTQVTVIYVETGWADENWANRVAAAHEWLANFGIKVVSIRPKAQFSELITARGGFPSIKFQWCAGLLKGIPILDWLETADPLAQATILVPGRRELARRFAYLPEFLEDSEHFGLRRVWHPLFAHTNIMLMDLLTKSPLPILGHRALECNPCVMSQPQDYQHISPTQIQHISALEQKLQQHFLCDPNTKKPAPLPEIINNTKNNNTVPDAGRNFDMGCGIPYGCGL